jgi:hypothetical protein
MESFATTTESVTRRVLVSMSGAISTDPSTTARTVDRSTSRALTADVLR